MVRIITVLTVQDIVFSSIIFRRRNLINKNYTDIIHLIRKNFG